MAQSSELPHRPSVEAPFGEWLYFYTQRANLSQNQLAIAAKMTQSTLNKIANERTKDVAVDTLIRLSLVLRLSEKETIDLMSRKERSLSPANPKHKLYLKIIRRNYTPKPDCKISCYALAGILDDADDILVKCGYEPISN